MKAMLLAAGLGTRLRPVTDAFAKPAVPFLNIPLLYYSVALLEPAGIDELVINTHHQPRQIESLTQSIPGFNGEVRISPEAGMPLGSGGGIEHARQWLDCGEDFLVANGDEVIFPSRPKIIAELVAAHRRSGAIATLLVMRHPGVGTQFGGVWTDKQHNVHGFGKQKPAHLPSRLADQLTGFHYVGVLALAPRVFKYLPEGESNLLYDALLGAIAAGDHVRIFEDRCHWYETGNIRDFVAATGHCLKDLAASQCPLPACQSNSHEPAAYLRTLAERFWPAYTSRPSFWKGHANEGRLVTHDNALCLTGNDVRVDGSAAVRGFAVLGNGVHVGRDCVLENCVVLPGARIPEGTHVSQTILTPKSPTL